MKRFVVRVLAVIGALFLLFIIIGLVFGILGKRRVPAKTVLEVNLERSVIEYLPDDPAAYALLSDRLVLRDLLDAIERAGNDDRVAGLVARFGGSKMGMGHVQEIRDAIIAFRAKKKFAYAFAETFGEADAATSSYYLATAFDKVYLQPSGDVALTGVIAEPMFIKGTLDKLGVRFRGDHRYEYKNAFNTFTETRFTRPHEEATRKYVDSWYGQVVRGISEARKLSQEEVKATVDRAPLYGKEALDAKLVDALKYRDEVYDEAKKQAGGGELLYWDKYLQRAGRPHQKGEVIALIYGAGLVVRGKSGFDPVFGSVTMGSESVAAAFRAAMADKKVKAILFRVDSPGGSYVASDTIWREVNRAQQAGKPVIISMGDVAASGGYFVSMPATKIVAQPGTITASIGVLGGKMYARGFWEKIGLTFSEVHNGANATMYTSTQDYTPAEWQRFQASLDRIYSDFTGKVADGRKLPLDRVQQIAKGRVWTGEDAKNLALVDELGGFQTALKLAKQAANISETEDVELRLFPKKKTWWQRLLGERPDNSEKEAIAQVLARVLNMVQPLARRMQVLTVGEGNELLAPEFAW